MSIIPTPDIKAIFGRNPLTAHHHLRWLLGGLVVQNLPKSSNLICFTALRAFSTDIHRKCSETSNRSHQSIWNTQKFLKNLPIIRFPDLKNSQSKSFSFLMSGSHLPPRSPKLSPLKGARALPCCHCQGSVELESARLPTSGSSNVGIAHPAIEFFWRIFQAPKKSTGYGDETFNDSLAPGKKNCWVELITGWMKMEHPILFASCPMWSDLVRSEMHKTQKR